MKSVTGDEIDVCEEDHVRGRVIQSEVPQDVHRPVHLQYINQSVNYQVFHKHIKLAFLPKSVLCLAPTLFTKYAKVRNKRFNCAEFRHPNSIDLFPYVCHFLFYLNLVNVKLEISGTRESYFKVHQSS